jgi:diguanylate cyclase (GGDEF)-like protein
MELLYKTGIKNDINLKEVEEILTLIFDELGFEKYENHIAVAQIIDTYLNLSNDRFGELFFYIGDKNAKIKISKLKRETTLVFHHNRKINRFFTQSLKDEIEIRKKYTLLVDSLTSLPNRRYFFNELQATINSSLLLNKKFAVIFLDIKGFKFINDFYGHENGDIVLQVVADRIKHSITLNSFLARIGADEFVIILKDINSVEIIKKYIKKIVENIEKPIQIDKNNIELSICVGVAIFPDDGITKDEIMLSADLALYELKHSDTKDNILFFRKEFKDRFLEHRSLEKDLNKALEKSQIYLLYQPKVNSQTGEVVGVEALLRWRHPIFGVLSNNKWIPLLENSRYLKPIGLWVLKKATNEIYQINKKLNMHLKVSVNSDIRELTNDYYLEELKKLPLYYREILTIELLERKAVKYWDELERIVKDLRTLQIRFSFDDFGTGNTSLRYLTKILPDELKIDRSFVSNIHTSKSRIITTAIIAMAKSLNIDIVAEGVEKEEEIKILHQLGCDIIQGYYYSKPIKKEELVEFLKNGIIPSKKG